MTENHFTSYLEAREYALQTSQPYGNIRQVGPGAWTVDKG